MVMHGDFSSRLVASICELVIDSCLGTSSNLVDLRKVSDTLSNEAVIEVAFEILSPTTVMLDLRMLVVDSDLILSD
jgi:hypothetical protein